jgi:hypothetical protein
MEDGIRHAGGQEELALRGHGSFKKCLTPFVTLPNPVH